MTHPERLRLRAPRASLLLGALVADQMPEPRRSVELRLLNAACLPDGPADVRAFIHRLLDRTPARSLGAFAHHLLNRPPLPC